MISDSPAKGYALRNRQEWEERGEQLLQEMIDACDKAEIPDTDHESRFIHDDHQSVDATASMHSNSSATPVEDGVV